MIVFDSSFFIAATAERDKTQLEKLDGIINAQKDIILPSLFCLEINNVLLRKLRNKTISGDERIQALDLLESLPIRLDYNCSEFLGAKTIADLARSYNITVYDAVYLEAAIRHKAKLGTIDKGLQNAAVAARVELA